MADGGTQITINDDTTVSETKRRFDARDWAYIADYVTGEASDRKRKRSDQEAQWKEIDRQVAMIPDISHKKLANGKVDSNKLWMSEMELPLQAQALEVLTADGRRMMFPDSGPWFRAHAQVTDDYLSRVDFQSLILGDDNEVPSLITQDNADKLVEGFLLHLFDQYDLESRMDRVNAESFRYGMGIGRLRMETKNVFIDEARGVRKVTQRLPVFVPVSVKNVLLDTPMPSMHSAQVLGQQTIAEDWMSLANLAIAASRGSIDPYDEDGGWMPQNLKGLLGDDDGNVRLLEMEGDIVVPRKTVRSFVLPGTIVTVAVGGTDGSGTVTRSVVRCRYRKYPFSSYLLFPYHFEAASDAYPTSPLMKGRTVQIMAVQALNRALDAAALKNSPPVGYDASDMKFAQSGGPVIHPYAQWATIDGVKVHEEIGGDPTAMIGMMTTAVNLYAELTGILPSRLGAQTVSHTTAYAKSTELSQGAVRTVDYVNTCGLGPLTSLLDRAYIMGRDALKDAGKIDFYIDSYGGFVSLSMDQLPPASSFEWFGAGGPAENAQKRQNKLASLQLAIQMDQVAAAYGKPPTVNIAAAQREVLRDGGWTDVDAITGAPQSAAAAPAAPGVPGAPGSVPAALPAALQDIAGRFAGRG